ncbi:MAG: acyl-CoA dehydrogenase N-terminal domain-containing protein, partial [Comamonas sp.]
MPQYTPPLRDMQFLMQEVLDLPTRFAQLPAYAEIDAGTMDAILEE